MIKGILEKYGKIIKYIMFSAMTAVIETVIGLAALNIFGLPEVISNTAGIVAGSAVHYLCVTKKVFDSSVGIKTAAVYISTFFLGMFIQNSVVWIVFRLLQETFGQSIVYLIAKCCSLCVSFVLMYGIRKFLYSKIGH